MNRVSPNNLPKLSIRQVSERLLCAPKRPSDRHIGPITPEDLPNNRHLKVRNGDMPVMRVGTCAQTGTMASVLLLILLAVVSPTAQAISGTTTLGVWEALDYGVQEPGELYLGPEETYEQYFFHLEPGDFVPVSVAFVEVFNGYGDFVCRGIVTHQGTLDIHQACPGLQPNRSYTISWSTDRVGTQLMLAGQDPIA